MRGRSTGADLVGERGREYAGGDCACVRVCVRVRAVLRLGAPTMFDVEYSCSKYNFVPSAYITVVIDMCAEGTDPKRCVWCGVQGARRPAS